MLGLDEIKYDFAAALSKVFPENCSGVGGVHQGGGAVPQAGAGDAGP